jgi:hypothetical protein
MENLTNNKVWIYQADRKFTFEEISDLNKQLSDFTDTWQAHGQNLSAGYEIRYDLFIVLWVNEEIANASGCSIDSSVRLIKGIEQKYGIDLFNRFNMAWKEKNEVKVAKREDFEKLVLNGYIKNETIVFNNMVTNGDGLENKWEVPFSESWHSKIFTTI